jgi:hypothetical protein
MLLKQKRITVTGKPQGFRFGLFPQQLLLLQLNFQSIEKQIRWPPAALHHEVTNLASETNDPLPRPQAAAIGPGLIVPALAAVADFDSEQDRIANLNTCFAPGLAQLEPPMIGIYGLAATG